MRKAQEGDIVRIRGGNRFELFVVTATSRSPKGGVTAASSNGFRTIPHDEIVIVTRRGNRYDYTLKGDIIE